MSQLGFAVSQRIQTALKNQNFVIPGNPGVDQRRHNFWHAQTYPAAGSTRIEFFNTDQGTGGRYVTNLPQSNQIGNNRAFVLDSVRLAYQSGDKLADSVALGASAVAAPLPFDTAEVIRKIFEQGLVNLRVDGRIVIDNMYGLFNFPQGGGYCVTPTKGAGGTTTATNIVDAESAIGSNGAPFAQNSYSLKTPWTIMPGQRIEMTVEYEALIPTASAAAKLIAYLDGQILTDSGISA